MREGEQEYWDGVADQVVRPDGGIYDNWLKRRFIGQFLLKCEWTGQKVLEIGVGCGASAALLSFSCGNQWSYIGTDVSLKFAKAAGRFGLKVIQADVLSLPEGEFTRIVALDSLEHVHPLDRDKGYEEIAKRLAKGGLLLINLPVDVSSHDEKFDHGIGLQDLLSLEEKGLILQKYERYSIHYEKYLRNYAFAVMTRLED